VCAVLRLIRSNGVKNTEIKRRFPTKDSEFLHEMGNYGLLVMSSMPWIELAGWLGN
jgi:hypothetical protein